jgi:hypothetical protein
MNEFVVGPYTFTVNSGRMAAWLGQPFTSAAVRIWTVQEDWAQKTAEDWVRSQCEGWLSALPKVGPPDGPKVYYKSNPKDAMEHACCAVETAMSQLSGSSKYGRMYKLYQELMSIAGKLPTRGGSRLKVAA